MIERSAGAGLEAPHTVYVGLGTNLGDRLANLARAAGALAALPGVELQHCSGVFASRPVGGPPQPGYLNAAIELHTSHAPLHLLAELKALERALGRAPSERWGPRLIDLDLLLWGTQVVAEPALQIPHLALHQRAFALAPLCELAPHAVHPVLGHSVQTLLAAVDVQGQGVARVGTFPGGW